MATLFIDLDGTLVDVRRRHYVAYADTLRELDMTPLSEHDYWDRRRQGASNADLIGTADSALHQRFVDRWLERVESPLYLRLDTLIPGARATLSSLRPAYELVLVTLRQDRASLLQQLDEFALGKFLSAVCSRNGAQGEESKAQLIRRAAAKVAQPSTVIGDSEADIATARALGSVSVCVTSGVRSRRFLEELAPDHLIPSIARLPDVLPVG